MSNAYIFADGKPSKGPFAEGTARFGQVDLVWLHLDGRGEAAKAWIAGQADIPDIARNALTATETRPRSDAIGHGAIINLRGLGKTPEDDPDALVSIRFWAETGRVISVSMRSPTAFEAVEAAFMAGKILDPGDVITAWASAITDGLDPEVAGLGDELDDLEVKLEMGMRRHVSRIRAQAIAYRRFVSPQRVALERLATTPCSWLDDDDRLHLREASDRFARMAEELESVRERSAIVHEELTDLRAEMIDSRGLFVSVLALIFLPLTFVTGLFGMNFDYLPFRAIPGAFMYTVWGSLALAVGMSLFFVRRHWLEK